MKKLTAVIFLSAVLILALCVPAFAAGEIDHDAAIDFATDFLKDYIADMDANDDFEIDYSKYISLEKLEKFLSAQSQYNKNLWTMGHYDPIVEQTELDITPVQADDLDGYVQVILTWTQDFKQEDWGWTESGGTAFILVGNGENGLEIRDFYKKGDFDPQRGLNDRVHPFKFHDPDFWESSEADELLVFQSEENRKALRRFVRPEYEYLFTNPDDEPFPETGREFPVVTAVFGIVGIGIIKKFAV